MDTLDKSKEVHYADSLDLSIGISSFITTNLPDTAQQVLYIGMDSLWSYIDSSINRGKKYKQVSFSNLHHRLSNAGFIIDTSGARNFALKRNYNKRYVVEWYGGHSDTITTQIQYWYKSRKYILINMRSY